MPLGPHVETAGRACRALAHVERESAEKINAPALRVPVQQRAQCAASLAERFERLAPLLN
jgi:hypothetical protein